MANSKKDRISLLDPNRFKIAKNNTYVPGGPMNNNPMNAEVGMVPSSLSGVNQYPYGDSGMVNPVQLGGSFPVPASGKPQGMVSGTGFQMGQGKVAETPDPIGQSTLEGQHNFADASKRGLFASALGITGMPGLAPDGMGPQDLLTNSMAVAPQGVPNAEAMVGKGINMKTGKRGKA